MDSQDREQVRVDLTLVHEGGRRMDSSPNGVAVGAVRLRNWQIDRIEVPADMFDGFDVHFVKINYELELEPDFPRMSWFDIAFTFVSGKEEDQAVVVDALPRFGTFADAPRSYALNQYLNFVLSEDDASVQVLLPAATDRVDAFGIGGDEVRWRHVALGEDGVRPGAYAAWVVLLTPAGQAEQEVEFSARYDLATGSDGAFAYRPTQVPVDFHLTLAKSAESRGVITPSFSESAGDPSEERGPSAFICYAHDTPQHKEKVLEFGNLLVRSGVDAHLDQWDVKGRKNWAEWSRKLIKKVDFVLVIASPICRKAFDRELKDPDNPGIRSESLFIEEKLNRHPDEWTSKVLPVVLPHEMVENVAESLHPWTLDHYEVEQLTQDGIDELLRAMTGVPRHSRPQLGHLPPGVLKP